MIAAVAAVAGICAFAAAYFALTSTRDARIRRRLARHMPHGHATGVRRSVRMRLEAALTETARRFEHQGLWLRADRLRRSAGLRWQTAELVWAIAGACAVVPLVLLLAGAPGALAVMALVATPFAAVVVLRTKARRRIQAFDEQLPEVLETLAATLKVGHSLQQSLQAVASETSDPAAGEFAELLHELRLGRTLESALDDLAERMDSEDFRFVVTSVAIQRQVGSSLSDLLQSVSETVRRRQSFGRKLNALTAMGRLSARVLLALPFVVAAGLTAVNPPYMRPLVVTGTGRTLLLVSMVMLACGTLVLKRLTKMKG